MQIMSDCWQIQTNIMVVNRAGADFAQQRRLLPGGVGAYDDDFRESTPV